ncbi:hypothetical protein CDD82_720 [Ophiocordyceps australis]|uniref:Uncharacterized protein n=1 Tax=Ophiocordyceps australis TaxID=1399860 RepID=A0A2C5YMG6_9HYPO|nr:hypothetical protein CDD82_720 [Ophiocordyceps australis]
MKFMQRAAASTDPNSDNSCSKKRKANGSSVQGRLDVNIDQALIQAAIDQQEATRQAALKEHSLVDTQWTMNNTLRQKSWNEAEEKPLDIVYVGYCDIDSANQMDNNMEAPATGLTSTKNTKQGDHQGSNKKRKFSDDDDDSGQTCSESLGESEACDGKRRKRNSTGGSNSLTPHSSPSLFVTNPSEESKAKEFGEKRSKKKMGFKQDSRATHVNRLAIEPLIAPNEAQEDGVRNLEVIAYSDL